MRDYFIEIFAVTLEITGVLPVISDTVRNLIE